MSEKSFFQKHRDADDDVSQSIPLLGRKDDRYEEKRPQKSTFEDLRKKVFSNSQKKQIDYGATLTQENLENPDLQDKSNIKQLGPLLQMKNSPSVDDFGETNSVADFKTSYIPNKATAIRSGRQRKKTAARSKGGEFQARRKKRRVYFCCLGSEMDVEGLADKFLQTSFMGLRGKMYSEVLHLYVENIPPASKEGGSADDRVAAPLLEEEIPFLEAAIPKSPSQAEEETNNFLKVKHDLFTIDEGGNLEEEEHSPTAPKQISSPDKTHAAPAKRHPFMNKPRSASYPGEIDGPLEDVLYVDVDNDQFDFITDNDETPRNSINIPRNPSLHKTNPPSLQNPLIPVPSVPNPLNNITEDEIIANSHYWSSGGREVFVFDFGAVVFWGYHRDEVKELLVLFQGYIVKGKLCEEEFKAGEDDMAFVMSNIAEDITISNDVVTLPEITSVKSRLAVSFAIAQSSILSIFEARIEEKIEDYKYIPEALAASGKIHLSAKELGNMIGEVFVIRHDVNLHNEILNIPDYFWKENSVEPLYRMTSMYLEMEPRTEVLNKRLDLLRELLKLLQHQHENSHNIKLEWIIIWLIVISVVLELFVMVGKLLKLWD